jgi:predicted nuclease with TOPRIM domain
MALIKFQPRPKVPPIGFFQPISVDPQDMMTDVEYLLGILKKLNETIKQVNSNTEFIDNYAGKIEELEDEINNLRQEMTDFENEINTEINDRFNTIKIELQSMVATALVQANAYTDSVASVLENEIQQISIGQISAFDPTTGAYSPLQTIIDNLYNSSRENALTATEYDGLELTATVYDGYELTATEYDQNAKTLLMPVSA